MNRSALLVGLGLLSAPSQAGFVQDVSSSLRELYTQQCMKAHLYPTEEKECQELKKKLARIQLHNQNARDNDLLPGSTCSSCPPDVHRVTRTIWDGFKKIGHYDPVSFIEMVECVENGLKAWKASCSKDPTAQVYTDCSLQSATPVVKKEDHTEEKEALVADKARAQGPEKGKAKEVTFAIMEPSLDELQKENQALMKENNSLRAEYGESVKAKKADRAVKSKLIQAKQQIDREELIRENERLKKENHWLDRERISLSWSPDCSKSYLQVGAHGLGDGNTRRFREVIEFKTWERFAEGRIHRELNEEEVRLNQSEVKILNYFKARPPKERAGLAETIFAEEKRVLQKKYDGDAFIGFDLNLFDDKKTAARIIRQLNTGLRNLHEADYIHSDLSLDNALLENVSQPEKVEAVYSDLGRAFYAYTACEKKLPLPITGHFNMSTPEEQSLDLEWPKGVSCEQMLENLKKRDVFSHALNVYMIYFQEDAVPCEPGDFKCRKKAHDALRAKLAKDLGSQKESDSIERLLVEALNVIPGRRPTAAEFEGRFAKLPI